MEKEVRDGSYQHAEELSNPEKGVTGAGVTSYQKAEKLGEKNVEEIHEFMADSNEVNDSNLKDDPNKKENLHNRASAHKDDFPQEDNSNGAYEKAEELGNIEKNIGHGGGSAYQTAEELGKETSEEQHEFMAESDGEVKK